MRYIRYIIIAIIFMAALAALSVYIQQKRTTSTIDTLKSEINPATDKVAQEVTEKVVPDPFSIPALQAREYPGSDIKIEQDLGNQNGFRSYIVSYTSDGLKLRALMNVPTRAKPDGGFPTLILNHGYIPPKEYNTISSYKAFGDYFARQGFIVFKPDYRGHAQSEGQAETANTAPYYVHDVLNLLASVKRHSDVNPDKIGMLGHSMGGGITLRAIVVSKDIKASVIAAGVVASPLEMWKLAQKSNDPKVPDYIKTAGPLLESRYGNPEQFKAAWDIMDPFNYAEHIVGPVQIHHGTADKDVPPYFSDLLNEALKAKGKPVEYHVYLGGDHNLGGKDRNVFLQRTVDFLNRELNK
jgi:uncharacterized protein